MTRARIFATLAAARAFRDLLPDLAAARWRLRLVDGRGDARGFVIANPGRAAARIRARGVFTHCPVMILRRDADQWAVPEPIGRTFAAGVDLAEDWRDAETRDGAI